MSGSDMVRCCCGPGCSQRDSKAARRNNITFHRLPLKNPVKLEKWLNAIHRQEQKNGEPWTPTGNSYLCSAHFTQDCFDLTGQTVRLRDHAVPSVFPNGNQKKTSAIHIKCLASSCQENACLPYPVIYLQDHLYHLPSNAAEKRLRNQKIPPSTAEEEFNYSSRFPELKPGQLRLYCHRLCPFSHRTKLVLEHKKIRYQPLNINLKSKPDWFLGKNPFGLVPVLERDDKIIYESLVCNDYLDDVCPVPHLQSADPYLRARDRMLIGQFDKDIKMVMNLKLNECQKADVKQKLVNHLQMLEKVLEKRGDYFGGDQVGILDFNLWPWFERFEALEDVTETLKGFTNNLPTKLTSWKARMLLQPAVQITMFNFQQHTEFLRHLLTENKNV